MPKWKTVRVRQELVEEAKKEMEKSQYKSLSEFVSDAIRLRMQKLAKERIPEYLERDSTAATVVLRHKEGVSAHKTCVKPDCFGANRDNPKCPDCGFLTECWNEVIKKYWCRGSADATARMRALYFRA